MKELWITSVWLGGVVCLVGFVKWFAFLLWNVILKVLGHRRSTGVELGNKQLGYIGTDNML